MDQILVNHRDFDYTLKFIIKNRPYIWGFIRDDQYEDGKIRCILTTNLTDEPLTTFSGILLIVENKTEEIHNSLINFFNLLTNSPDAFLDNDHDLKNLFTLKDKNIVNLKTPKGNIELATKNFRPIRTRVEAHETLVKQRLIN